MRPLIPQSDFNEITQLIHAARQRAVLAVNTAIQGQHRNSFAVGCKAVILYS